MADQLQLRGGTTVEHSTFTGALREVTVDIDKDTVVVHDNTTAGGHPLAKEDLSNVSGSDAATALADQTVAFNLGAAATPSVTFNGDTNTGIYSPGADQLALSTSGVQRINIEADGDINIDSGGVFYDATNNRLAIGTTSVDKKLVIAGDNTTGGENNTLRFVDTDTSSISEQITGKIEFYTSDTDGAGVKGYIAGITRNNGGDGCLIFGTGGSGAATEKLRLDDSGRLLVGTSTSASSALLQVQGRAGGATNLAEFSLRRDAIGISTGSVLGRIRFEYQGGGEGAFIDAAADGTNASGDYPTRLVFSTTADGASSPTERMRIASDGRHFTFSAGAITHRSPNGANSSDALLIGIYSGTSITSGGSASFYVRTNGNVENTNNSYGAISDIKLKENIVDANSQWDDLKALRVRNYNFKEGQTHTQIGLVAQEVELVSPGLVSESLDRDEDGNDLGTVTKTVNYSVLYMKAVKALQEAMERIETLEAKVAALETP